MILTLIVAMTQNRVIGKNNRMPWHLPVDLAWFKEKTIGKPIVMGRKTFESIGHPLPNRINIVLSHKPFQQDNVWWANGLKNAIDLVQDQFKNQSEIMLIGGGELFKQAMPYASKLYLTEIQAILDGDTFFPELDSNWIAHEFYKEVPADSKNQYACKISQYRNLQVKPI